MANYWMHNGFLQVEGEKMSKSLGNFVTIHELLKDWPGEASRFKMLRTHYRQPIDWTVSGLAEAQKNLGYWYALHRRRASQGIAVRRRRSTRCSTILIRRRHCRAARIARRSRQRRRARAARLPEGERATAWPAADRPSVPQWAALRPMRAIAIERKQSASSLIERAQRRAQGEELQGSRPHPRRARRHGRRARRIPRTAPPGRSRDDGDGASQAGAAAVSAGGCAAAARNLPRQHRGADRRRLQRGAAGGLGLRRRRREGASATSSPAN